MPPWHLLALAALAGLALGSYAVTAGVRYSRGERSSRGRSHCDHCGEAQGFARTLPLVSYARLRGVCADCGARIDPIHVVGELAGATIVVSAAAVGDAARIAPLLALGLALLAAAAVDAKIKRLPDALTLVVAASGLALALMRDRAAVEAGLIAAAVSAAVLLAIRALARHRGGDPGLGLGDVKLIAALALWLGAAVPAMVALASLLGLAAAPFVGRPDRRIAFGPFIAVAAWGVGMAMEWGWTSWA